MALPKREVSRAVFAGRTAEIAPEQSAKRSDALETHFQTNVGHAAITLLQKALGVCEALALKILIGCFAEDLSKKTMKVVRGKACLLYTSRCV